MTIPAARWLVAVAVSLLLCSASPARAKAYEFQMQDLIAFSDLVFVGKVHMRGSEVLIQDSFVEWGRVEMSVDEVVCGQFHGEGWPSGRVQVLYPLNLRGLPSLEVGADYLFFMRIGYSGPELAPQYYGAMAIGDGLVDLRVISDVGRAVPRAELTRLVDCSALGTWQRGLGSR